FDVAEGEPELVAGFHTEYGAMQFGLFYMGEYSHIGINSILVACLFLGGYSVPFVTTETIQSNIGISLAVLCGIFVVAILAFLHLLYRYARWYKKSAASNKQVILREYSLYKILGWAAVVVFAAAGVASALFFHPEFTVIDGQPVYGIGVALGTALIHILVLLVKAIFFCWIWIWVRWTLPRFRYDHVMNLGWKVILNIALINLVVTALIAKLLGGI
ncbi:MAG TPA: NADH-quinone oxidoreductase subunit H, partial [Fibrobacteraceae bacterium]|nr:NADH-quinone oxidoreductase subunit H [Fibrobacteraceae bacterium]